MANCYSNWPKYNQGSFDSQKVEYAANIFQLSQVGSKPPEQLWSLRPVSSSLQFDDESAGILRWPPSLFTCACYQRDAFDRSPLTWSLGSRGRLSCLWSMLLLLVSVFPQICTKEVVLPWVIISVVEATLKTLLASYQLLHTGRSWTTAKLPRGVKIQDYSYFKSSDFFVKRKWHLKWNSRRVRPNR